MNKKTAVISFISAFIAVMPISVSAVNDGTGFEMNEKYDVLKINNNFNNETNAGSADGSNYMISDGTYKIWNNSENGLYYGDNFHLSADIMFNAENQTIEFTNSGNNKGPALYISGSKLISSAGNKKQTLYSNAELNKWYKIEYEGRMGVTGAVTNFKLYNFDEAGTATEISSYSKLELRNFWGGNNKFPSYATAAAGICIDNEYAVQMYPDTVTITESNATTEISGGDTLTFAASATRSGVIENLTQPEITWGISGILDGEEEYFGLSEDGVLSVSALAGEQKIIVTATASSNGNPYAEYPITVHTRNLSGEPFDKITLSGDETINAGESKKYVFTAMNGAQDVTDLINADDVVWTVMNSTGTKALNNKNITVSNGILSVGSDVIGQNVKVRISTVSGFVYGELDVTVNSVSYEAIINENACEEKVDGVLLNSGSWDGSSYYVKDTSDDFLTSGTLKNTTSNGDLLVCMDLNFKSQTGSGITTIRRDGGTGLWLVSHDGVLACQTGGSSYRDLTDANGNTYPLDTESWYHIELMFATTSPSLNIWKYDENGTLVEQQTFTPDNGMTFRSLQGFNRIKLNSNTGIDNYRVLTPKATSLEIISDVKDLSAGSSTGFTPSGSRNGLLMPNLPMENVAWAIYDSDNNLPIDNENITITAGKLSTYGLTAPQTVYVRATSIYDKTIYASYPINIVANNIFKVTNIGVSEFDENKIVKIFVDKNADYDDDVTFIITLYNADGVLVGSYAKKANGKNLKDGANEISADYLLPQGYNKDDGTAKVFVWTSMSTNENPAGVSTAFSATYNNGTLTFNGLPQTSARTTITIYKPEINDNELSGNLDEKVVYASQSDGTNFGTVSVPDLKSDEYTVIVGTTLNGEYVVYKATFVVE